MVIRGICTLGLLLSMSACGETNPTPDKGGQSADAPRRQIALQDLVNQKKISYATAVRCMYLADATKSAADTPDRNDRVKYNAKFYALQLIQDNPGKIDADVGSQFLQETINNSLRGSDEEIRAAASQLDVENGKEFEAICVPIFLEQQ